MKARSLLARAPIQRRLSGGRDAGVPRAPTRCGSPAPLCAGTPLSRDARRGAGPGGTRPAARSQRGPAARCPRRSRADDGSASAPPRTTATLPLRSSGASPAPRAPTFSDRARGPSRGAGGAGLLEARSGGACPSVRGRRREGNARGRRGPLGVTAGSASKPGAVAGPGESPLLRPPAGMGLRAGRGDLRPLTCDPARGPSAAGRGFPGTSFPPHRGPPGPSWRTHLPAAPARSPAPGGGPGVAAPAPCASPEPRTPPREDAARRAPRLGPPQVGDPGGRRRLRTPALPWSFWGPRWHLGGFSM